MIFIFYTRVEVWWWQATAYWSEIVIIPRWNICVLLYRTLVMILYGIVCCCDCRYEDEDMNNPRQLYRNLWCWHQCCSDIRAEPRNWLGHTDLALYKNNIKQKESGATSSSTVRIRPVRTHYQLSLKDMWFWCMHGPLLGLACLSSVRFMILPFFFPPPLNSLRKTYWVIPFYNDRGSWLMVMFCFPFIYLFFWGLQKKKTTMGNESCSWGSWMS